MINRIKKGFTIVELVIVIAVIAILAGVLIPTFSGVVARANQSAALTTARNTLDNALLMSSTASLKGEVDGSNGKTQKTVFVVDGYAFGYTGNSLYQIDYPQGLNVLSYNKDAYKSDNTSDNFNTILLKDVFVEKFGETYRINADAFKIIADATNLDYVTENTAPTITKGESGNYTLICKCGGSDVEIPLYINSEFPKNVILFTTFG